jgi:hypothetical protein
VLVDAAGVLAVVSVLVVDEDVVELLDDSVVACALAAAVVFPGSAAVTPAAVPFVVDVVVELLEVRRELPVAGCADRVPVAVDDAVVPTASSAEEAVVDVVAAAGADDAVGVAVVDLGPRAVCAVEAFEDPDVAELAEADAEL